MFSDECTHIHNTPTHNLSICLLLFCVYVCLPDVYMFVTVYLVPTVSRRGCQITELGLQMVVRILDSFS